VPFVLLARTGCCGLAVVGVSTLRHGGMKSDNRSRNTRRDFPKCGGAFNREIRDNASPLLMSAEPSNENINEPSTDEAATGAFGKMKAMFKTKNDDGLTTKERLAKLGLSAFLSYGWISNMSYAVALSLSWYGFSAKTGLSPLAPGQWKPFLAIYAGFYAFNNIVRPVRFAASVAVTKTFEDFIAFVGRRTKLSRRGSIAVVVILVNVCGTFAAMGFGVTIASYASGVPIFPSKS